MKNNKKKILIRIGSMQGGGAEKVLLTILQHLNYQQYQVHLLLNTKRGVYLDQVPKEVIVKHIVEPKQINNPLGLFLHKVQRRTVAEFYKKYPVKLYGKIIDEDYDVEIAFLQDIAPEVSQSPIKKSKKIAWIHTDMIQYQNKNPKLAKKIQACLPKFNEIVSVTEKANARTKEFLHQPKTPKFSVIYNPLDINRIVRKAQEPSQINFTKDGLNIISIARLQKVKGINRIPEIAQLLKQQTQKIVQFHLVGEGEEKEDIQNQIIAQKIQNIHFHGYVEEPYNLIKQADLVLVPSWHEGFSLVVAEAMVLNKAIVSSNTIGPTELLKNGKLGKITENNNQALAIGLAELINNPNNRQAYEQELAKENFNFGVETVKKQIQELFS